MKTWHFLGILIILVAAVGFALRMRQAETGASSDSAQASPTYANITADQLRAMVSKQPVLVLDVREPDEYAAGHIRDAVLMPLGSVQDNLSKLPKDGPVIVVCRSGRRSATAADILVKAGFSRVFNLTGGMLAWPYEIVR